MLKKKLTPRKKIFFFFFFGVIAAVIICVVLQFGCASGNGGGTSVSVQAKDGLDLQGLTALVKAVKTGDELEAKLNAPDSINNLDLNGDGDTDYINVTEFGSGDS